MSPEPHRIGRLHIRIATPDLDRALALRARAEELTWKLIPRVLERVFDALAPMDQTLGIDRLELGLGHIAAATLERDTLAALERELTRALRGVLGPLSSQAFAAADAGLVFMAADAAQARTPDAAPLARFCAWLAGGIVPLRAAGEPFDPAAALVRLLHEMPGALVAALSPLLGEPHALDRLVLHASDAGLTGLCAALAPGGAGVMPPDVSGSQAKRLALWRQALRAAPPSEADSATDPAPQEAPVSDRETPNPTAFFAHLRAQAQKFPGQIAALSQSALDRFMARDILAFLIPVAFEAALARIETLVASGVDRRAAAAQVITAVLAQAPAAQAASSGAGDGAAVTPGRVPATASLPMPGFETLDWPLAPGGAGYGGGGRPVAAGPRVKDKNPAMTQPDAAVDRRQNMALPGGPETSHAGTPSYLLRPDSVAEPGCAAIPAPAPVEEVAEELYKTAALPGGDEVGLTAISPSLSSLDGVPEPAFVPVREQNAPAERGADALFPGGLETNHTGNSPYLLRPDNAPVSGGAAIPAPAPVEAVAEERHKNATVSSGQEADLTALSLSLPSSDGASNSVFAPVPDQNATAERGADALLPGGSETSHASSPPYLLRPDSAPVSGGAAILAPAPVEEVAEERRKNAALPGAHEVGLTARSPTLLPSDDATEPGNVAGDARVPDRNAAADALPPLARNEPGSAASSSRPPLAAARAATLRPGQTAAASAPFAGADTHGPERGGQEPPRGRPSPRTAGPEFLAEAAGGLTPGDAEPSTTPGPGTFTASGSGAHAAVLDWLSGTRDNTPLDVAGSKNLARLADAGDPALDDILVRCVRLPALRARWLGGLTDDILLQLLVRLVPVGGAMLPQALRLLAQAAGEGTMPGRLNLAAAFAVAASLPSAMADARIVAIRLARQASGGDETRAHTLLHHAAALARAAGSGEAMALLTPAANTPPSRRAPPGGFTPPPSDQNIYIANAGLVILSPYLPVLFERLTLFTLGKDGRRRITGLEAATRAVRLLQYLVDTQPGMPEPDLVLNKLLTGLAPAEPVVPKLTPLPAELDLCDDLLRTVISHWTILQNSSIAALRETFLQREGRLRHESGRWMLHVQRRGVDALLDQLPWSISVIYHGWMQDPIHVTW